MVSTYKAKVGHLDISDFRGRPDAGESDGVDGIGGRMRGTQRILVKSLPRTGQRKRGKEVWKEREREERREMKGVEEERKRERREEEKKGGREEGEMEGDWEEENG